MKTAKKYAERVPYRRALKWHIDISQHQWVHIERLSGVKLDKESREQIQIITSLYCAVGPLYSPTNSVLTSVAKRELEAFVKAADRLQKHLNFDTDNLSNLFSVNKNGTILVSTKGYTHVGKAVLMSLLASAQATAALLKLTGASNGRIDVDLWAAWAELLSRRLEMCGLSLTASSNNKSAGESVYVKTIMAFQAYLPPTCQRNTTYESIRVALGETRRQFGDIPAGDLLQLFAGWVTQLLSSYPGNLLKASGSEINAFPKFAKTMRDDTEATIAQLRNAKSKL